MVEEIVTEWYPTKQMALDRVNGKFTVFGSSNYVINGSNGTEEVVEWIIPSNKLIGIFKAERLDLEQVKVGTHQVPVQKTDYVEMPTMEWREKQ